MRPLRRLGVPAGLLLTGCASEPVTTQGKQIESLYYTTLALAVLIFVGVVGTALWSVFRYRRKPGDDTLPPQVHGNTTAEIIWTVIPIVIVLVLFAMSYTTLRSVDKRSGDDEIAALIHVRGYQWFWEFDYGDDRVVAQGADGKAPVLAVPAGETVRVVMTSDNVNHAWFVPNFLFKKDVIVGKPNTFEFRVDVPGRYKGQCAELCGTRHADMVFEVLALQRPQFEEYLEKNVPPRGCKGDERPQAAVEVNSPPGAVAFDKNCLVVPANRPFTVKYDHLGGLGQPHNVAIRQPQTGAVVFGIPQAALINDNQSITYRPAPLAPGSYEFFCQVHPGMKGQLLAKEGA